MIKRKMCGESWLVIGIAVAMLIVAPACRPATAATYGKQLGSGSSAAAVGWDATQWTRATALLGTQINEYQWTDLLNSSEYTIVDAGVNKTTQLAGATGGVVRIGITSTAYIFPGGMINNAPPSSAPPVQFVGNQQTQSWAIASRVRVPTSVTSGSHFVDLMDTSGITDGTGTGIRINGNVSTTVIQMFQTGTNTAGNSSCTLGGSLTVNTFFDVMLTWNAGTSTMTMLCNGVVGATVTGTTNVPTQAAVVDANTNVVNQLDVDKMWWAFGDML